MMLLLLVLISAAFVLFTADYCDVIYAAYRTALKLLHIRNNLHCKYDHKIKIITIVKWYKLGEIKVVCQGVIVGFEEKTTTSNKIIGVVWLLI